MQTRAVQVILLICSLILAIIILIASSKYAAWSHEMVPGPGKWLPLVFYVGTIPFFSLLYTVSHLAALQFNGLPSPPYLYGRASSSGAAPQQQAYDAGYTVRSTFLTLCVSVAHTLMWFSQSILCTSCELAPILAGHQGQVPQWCPQSRFHDTGNPNLANMLGTLAPVKDFLQWTMFALAAALIECARREWMRAEHVRAQQTRLMGAGVDFGGYGDGGGGGDFVKKTTPMAAAAAAGGVVELGNINISGPRLVFRAEEAARREQDEAKKRRQQGANGGGRGDNNNGAPLPPAPVLPPTGKKKDNYYGNGMGLKRSGTTTLNHMYESRV
ncbi:uncharacterized protein Z520_08703 [Fonsecaea multimorphosa CBS 102226]|uniref:Uncharacterized protein n=1 Tax=Fonsecaea multimorphosa CBS 102226 TaxID=1442371 RepID=A0A0D2KFY1_9EURO|nr:uncharacterized protein Z520_08703 [Fonsecaea multimorphosa CBS 102226]KIX95583.1 hypothetical protein Z520_08703 [Fonsecaea multimorphosa CBS 102226]OAL21189.1 hypothetical protein AYO22_08152 [Fonsecaea multimorphosa]